MDEQSKQYWIMDTIVRVIGWWRREDAGQEELCICNLLGYFLLRACYDEVITLVVITESGTGKEGVCIVGKARTRTPNRFVV